MQMRGTLPGCTGEDQVIAERQIAEEARLDEMVSVDVQMTIYRVEFRESVRMSRRSFEKIESEIDTDLEGLFNNIDCGDIDFSDCDVNIDEFSIRE